MQRERAAVVHRARFNFMSEARIWDSRDADQATFPGGFRTKSFSATNSLTRS
jgi:hypothetical protein